MKAIILNGFDCAPELPVEALILSALERLLTERKYQSIRFDAADMNIKPCRGCFCCWVKTPGRCIIKDDQEAILACLAVSELRILLTPVSFGGYGYQLKKVMDRSIPILLPFFSSFHGEVHHPQRYPGQRRLLVIGSSPVEDGAMNDSFSKIAQRNALNMQIESRQALVFSGSPSELTVTNRLHEALHKLEVKQ